MQDGYHGGAWGACETLTRGIEERSTNVARTRHVSGKVRKACATFTTFTAHQGDQGECTECGCPIYNIHSTSGRSGRMHRVRVSHL
eukprot:1158157-Pelagomonas_calceolata.AAC.14